MTKNELLAMLDDGDIEVTFIKKTTGETRVMRCSKEEPPTPVEPEEPITVYDLDKGDYRKFYPESVIKVRQLPNSRRLLQE